MSKRKWDETQEPMPELTEDGPSEITIARNPDVAVLLNNQAQTRLLVNSSILRNASRVFDAMLGPNFSEGHRMQEALREGGELFEIELPEDDAHALMAVLYFLHNNVAPLDTITTGIVRGVSIISDKYDLKSALHFVGWHLLGPVLWPHPRDAMRLDLVVAAYNFKDVFAFRAWTAMSILDSTESYMDIISLKGMPVVFRFALLFVCPACQQPTSQRPSYVGRDGNIFDEWVGLGTGHEDGSRGSGLDRLGTLTRDIIVSGPKKCRVRIHPEMVLVTFSVRSWLLSQTSASGKFEDLRWGSSVS